MSDEKINRLEKLVDEHDKRITGGEKAHAVNDERFKGWAEWRKRVDTRLRDNDGKWSWLVKIVAAAIIMGLISLLISGSVPK
jgi:hypothetical protein